MWFGRPVIGTRYSGNLDYMTPENSYLVDYRLVARGSAHDRVDDMWAEPDIDHAARLMREVFEDREGAARRGATAAQDIRRTHAPAIAGDVIGRRLESIRATGRCRRVEDPARSGRPPAVARLPLRIRQGPGPGAVGGPGGRVRALARKALLRAIGPYAAYQRAINAELVAGLAELSDSIADGRRESAAEMARRMAEVRRLERELGSRK
jgi:hypothetical protein